MAFSSLALPFTSIVFLFLTLTSQCGLRGLKLRKQEKFSSNICFWYWLLVWVIDDVLVGERFQLVPLFRGQSELKIKGFCGVAICPCIDTPGFVNAFREHHLAFSGKHWKCLMSKNIISSSGAQRSWRGFCFSMEVLGGNVRQNYKSPNFSVYLVWNCSISRKQRLNIYCMIKIITL